MRVTLYKLKRKKKKEKEKGISLRKRRQLKVDELLVNRVSGGLRQAILLWLHDVRCDRGREAINRVSIIGNRDEVKKKKSTRPINFDSLYGHWLKKCKYKCPPASTCPRHFYLHDFLPILRLRWN